MQIHMLCESLLKHATIITTHNFAATINEPCDFFPPGQDFLYKNNPYIHIDTCMHTEHNTMYMLYMYYNQVNDTQMMSGACAIKKYDTYISYQAVTTGTHSYKYTLHSVLIHWHDHNFTTTAVKVKL